jgi:type VI secretion system protein ImpE
MQAEAYLQSGDLDKALAELTNEIRSKPAKVELRIFLFQLLGVLGQWERAMTQLNVAAEMDADAALMAQVYRPALNCEAFRANVFQGERTPLFFGEPSEWMVSLTQIPGLLAAGKTSAAVDLRDKAFDLAPAVSGQIDGEPFAWMADADERLGPTLEAVVNGKYYWVAWPSLVQVKVAESHMTSLKSEGSSIWILAIRSKGTQ